jgi:signal transduction histidine kinase
MTFPHGGMRFGDPRPGIVAVGTMLALGTVGLFARRVWWLHADDQTLRAAFETTITLLLLLACVLLAGRARQTRGLRDLLLVFALAVASLKELVTEGLPVHGVTPAFETGDRALALLIAATLAAAALMPPERTIADARRLLLALAGGAVCVLACGAAVGPVLGPLPASAPTGDHRPLSVATALATFLLLGGAAAVFASHRRRGDANAGPLAAATLLLGLAYTSVPALTTDPPGWMTPADGLRLAACAAFLVAVRRMTRETLAELGRDALTAERQRIARDLHDGLTQDLALIVLHSERLACDYGADHPLATAARRALAISRGQIVDLEAAHAETTEAAIREVADEFSERYGVEVSVSVDDARSGDVSPSRELARMQLVRIAREAIANAVRHGRAGRVDVRLGAGGDGPMLRVSDDGCGFAGASKATAGTGLGMRAMGERAQLLGAEVTAAATACGGAQLEVTVPARRRRWLRAARGAGGARVR